MGGAAAAAGLEPLTAGFVVETAPMLWVGLRIRLLAAGGRRMGQEALPLVEQQDRRVFVAAAVVARVH